VPNHQRALWFRGIAALQSGDAAGAVARWEALLPQVDAATAEALREQIDGARRMAGLPPAEAAPEAPAAASRTLQVTLEADPADLATLPPQAVLFVFARNAEAAARRWRRSGFRRPACRSR
jgi:cytochrome c-type biogenesis protein CcmH